MSDDIMTRLRSAEWYCNASEEHMGYCNKKCAKRNLPNPDECRAAADEIKQLRKRLKDIKDGFEGCCPTCEPVGIKNKQLIELLHEILDDQVALLESFDELTEKAEDLTETIDKLQEIIKGVPHDQ